MKYYYRVINWTTKEDYTAFLTYPIFIEDHLDETLDTGEIILDCMPVETRHAFPPKTKIKIYQHKQADYLDQPEYWDMVVDHDDVEEYIGTGLCCHRVHLIEASVIAQGIHVDNIDLTYELADVNLNYRIVPSGEYETLGSVFPEEFARSTISGPQEGYTGEGTVSSSDTHTWEFQYSLGYKYEWDSSIDIIKGMPSRYDAREDDIDITLPVPKLNVYAWDNNDGWKILAQINSKIAVMEQTIMGMGGVYFENGEEVVAETFPIMVVGPGVLPQLMTFGLAAYLPVIEPFKSEESITHQEKLSFIPFLKESPIITTARILGTPAETITFRKRGLSEEEIKKGYTRRYVIRIEPDPPGGLFQDGFITHIRAICYSKIRFNGSTSNPAYFSYYRECPTVWIDKIYPNDLALFVSIAVEDTSSETGGPFLRRSSKYSCLEMINKALLCSGTYFVNNFAEGISSVQLPIAITDAELKKTLAETTMFETLFEGKNLWEVLLQVGKYIHSIPYLEFADDSTNRFGLRYRKLGGSIQNADNSTKLSVFNSRNLSEFFSSFDSYVSNFFSPQMVVEEWVVPKTSDSTYLIYNDTIELHVTKPILQIEQVIIKHMTTGSEADITERVFAEPIYQILSSDNPMKITPAKGNSIYYVPGTNKIVGLTFASPKASGVYPTALKMIIEEFLDFEPAGARYNNYSFYIKYRTQDDVRLTSFRPDIQDFVKNSSYEQYPRHEQFYSQQDKIVDSERFSANLFGQLIRTGNATYQVQEYATADTKKESGELVKIDEENYYVTAIENELYQDAILQKVTYSKDFNQLSQIVTIPSEPRYYEVSERSNIRREKRIISLFSLSDKGPLIVTNPTYYQGAMAWGNLLKELIFGINLNLTPNYAFTEFFGDAFKTYKDHYGIALSRELLFPSSDIERTGSSTIVPKESSASSKCIVPLLKFPIKDGIVFEWDMEDNFKAGDFVDVELNGHVDEGFPTDQNAYYSMQAMRYCDVFGRADMCRFALFQKRDWTHQEMQRLPNLGMPEVDPARVAVEFPPTAKPDRGWKMVLLKGNREAISFNFQISLLHRTPDFITYANLFGEKDAPLKMCLLLSEQNKFESTADLRLDNIIKDGQGKIVTVDYEFSQAMERSPLKVVMTTPGAVLLEQVKAIALYQEDIAQQRYAYIVRNVGHLPDEEKLAPWYIYPVYTGNG